MSSFTEPLAYRSTEVWRNGRRLYQVIKGFSFASDLFQIATHVPTGFRTDLGSIPAFVRWWLSPDDPWAQAFVLHDRLYAIQADREVADMILWESLTIPYRMYDERGVMGRVTCGVLKRSAIYWAVRIGGRRAYSGSSVRGDGSKSGI